VVVEKYMGLNGVGRFLQPGSIFNLTDEGEPATLVTRVTPKPCTALEQLNMNKNREHLSILPSSLIAGDVLRPQRMEADV